jgi:hypothetical protein
MVHDTGQHGVVIRCLICHVLLSNSFFFPSFDYSNPLLVFCVWNIFHSPLLILHNTLLHFQLLQHQVHNADSKTIQG